MEWCCHQESGQVPPRSDHTECWSGTGPKIFCVSSQMEISSRIKAAVCGGSACRQAQTAVLEPCVWLLEHWLSSSSRSAADTWEQLLCVQVCGCLFYLSGRGIIDRWLSGRDEALQQNSAAPARCERQRNGSRGDRLVTFNTAGDGREQG